MKFAVILFLISVLTRFLLVQMTGFDGLYGQDPFAYFNYSLELRQALSNLQPPPSFFWPLGYPLLVVLGTLAAGSEPFAGQSISVIPGALVAPLIYLIVLELRPARRFGAADARFGAAAAGLLAAFSAQLMLSSLSIMSDAAALFWITLSAWAMLRYLRHLSLGWLALAAFALGWAVLTRWAYALAVLPWAVSALFAWRAARLPWRKTLLAAGTAILVAGLLVGWQLIPGAGRGEIAFAGDLRVYSWDPANAFRSTITNFDGLFQYERPMGLFYALPAVQPAFVFPLMLPFLLLGLWKAVHLNRPQALLLLGWPLTMYVFLAGVAWQNPRFSLAFYPPLLAITGLGIQHAWNWSNRLNTTTLSNQKLHGTLSRHLPLATCHLPLATRYFLAFLLALALAGALAWSFRDVGNFAHWSQSRVDAASWVEARVPAGSTLVAFDLTATLSHYTNLNIEEIYALDLADLAALKTGTAPLYLLLDVANVESQWRDKSPQINYHWLRDNGRLTEIGRFPPYTLYSMEPD
jgi:4-amino-4-deoxy-L-arabinose transferase-like glycosyltransferase